MTVHVDTTLHSVYRQSQQQETQELTDSEDSDRKVMICFTVYAKLYGGRETQALLLFNTLQLVCVMH